MMIILAGWRANASHIPATLVVCVCVCCRGEGSCVCFWKLLHKQIIFWHRIPSDIRDHNTAERILRSHHGERKENKASIELWQRNFHFNLKLEFYSMLKLVCNFSNEKFHKVLISIFFSHCCPAVKVDARSRYPKDTFEFKNATHNSRLVTKPGERVPEPIPIFNNYCASLNAVP